MNDQCPLYLEVQSKPKPKNLKEARQTAKDLVDEEA